MGHSQGRPGGVDRLLYGGKAKIMEGKTYGWIREVKKEGSGER